MFDSQLQQLLQRADAFLPILSVRQADQPDLGAKFLGLLIVGRLYKHFQEMSELLPLLVLLIQSAQPMSRKSIRGLQSICVKITLERQRFRRE